MVQNLSGDVKIQAVEINTLVIQNHQENFSIMRQSKSLSQNWPIKFSVPGSILHWLSTKKMNSMSL